MCLDLRNSQFNSITEVEDILSSGKPTEYIKSIQNNRKLIEKNLRLIQNLQDLTDLGYF